MCVYIIYYIIDVYNLPVCVWGCTSTSNHFSIIYPISFALIDYLTCYLYYQLKKEEEVCWSNTAINQKAKLDDAFFYLFILVLRLRTSKILENLRIKNFRMQNTLTNLKKKVCFFFIKI